MFLSHIAHLLHGFRGSRLLRRHLTPLRGLMYQPTCAPEIAQEIMLAADWVRYGTLALALERIDLEQIPGSLAELGVYKGDTSRFIHRQKPGRLLYLFDTFSGFAPQDLEPGTNVDWSSTSIEAVLSRIKPTDNIEVRAGHFPESARGLQDQRFALVMIDMDLYKPIKAALELFYPRMSEGGYIFVHDFNYDRYAHGARRAAQEFFMDKPERLIEVPDMWGTAVCRKVG